MARPSKLTPELMIEADRWLKVTPYEQTVSDYLSIDRTCWYGWKVRGQREKQGLYREFFHMVQKAKATWELTLLLELRKGGDHWQRHAWQLERAIPSRWGKRLELLVKERAEVLAAEAGCTAAELIAEAERIAASV